MNNNMALVLNNSGHFTFLQHLYNHIDYGNDVFYLFLGFRNAFDFVNHEILLSKLNTDGIRGITLDWFGSYLTN